MDFGPGTELVGIGAPATAGSVSGQSLGLLDWDGGGVPVQPPPSVDSPGANANATAWVLVARAAAQCGVVDVPQLPPWARGVDGGGSWFVYRSLGTSCAERLNLEQNLVCIADKLAEVGDAVQTVLWPHVTGPSWLCGSGNAPPFAYGSDAAPGGCDALGDWQIPPQADKDRFIVRDLAIHTLGMLATLDAIPLYGSTCGAVFGNVASGTAPITNNATTIPVFGVPLLSPDANGGCQPNSPVYPPSDVSIVDPGYTYTNPGCNATQTSDQNARVIARSALQIQAHILRSGGRLLHDLIRRNVYSDMASAEQLAAHALDPDNGNQLAWGVQGPYGTLAHAARVLVGRWEIGDATFGMHADPRCEGVPSIGLLTNGGNTSAFGDELTARTEDRPLRTKGEARASSLVEQAGIVFPSCAIAANSVQALRSALGDQLLVQEQVRNGLSPNPTSPQRAVYDRLTSPLADAEVLVGFKRALRTYRLLTNSADGAGGAAGDAGVGCAPVAVGVAGINAVPQAAVAPSVASLKGVVIDGGIARSRLATDPIARAAGMLEASQCMSNADTWTEWGTSNVDINGQLPTQVYPIPAEVFQDAFHIGQALGRRLVLLRAAADPVKGGFGDPESAARGGIAEVRAWAGSTIVHAWQQANPRVPTTPPWLTVRVSGTDYADLGVSAGAAAAARQQAVSDAFGFVFGPPWVAECAVHARTACPANFDATWVQHPVGVVDNADDPQGTNYAAVGEPGPVFEFTIPIASSDSTRPANFNPVINSGLPNNAHLYMVRLHDPSDSSGHGRVLGTIPLVANGLNRVVGFVVSPMQRELLHNAIDLGRWVGRRPPGIGDPSAAKASGYCVDGVPRDIFVPLENELTSDSDTFENSWKHYLGLAQQAAARADQLGQDLINLDLKIDERKEAAGEALADICGDFGIVDRVATDNSGHVAPNPDDPTLSVCLNEPTKDIVFLADVPAPLAKIIDPTGTQQTQWIRDNVIKCGQSSDDLCNATRHPSLTFDALRITTRPPPPSLGGACAGIQDLAASKITAAGFRGTDFRGVLADPLFGSSSMAAIASSLKMSVDLWDNWQVTYAGKTIMSSTSAPLWPACLSNGSCDNVGKALNTAFRYCPGITDPAALATAPLGQCDIVPGDPTPAASELNTLRWRVAGAMWMIGASSGQVHAGMFEMPIPVVTWPLAPSSANVFLGAAYTGQLAQQPGSSVTQNGVSLAGWGLQASAGTTSSADVLAMGTVYDLAPAWASFTASASNEIPPWYLALYAPSARGYVKHAFTANTAVTFPQYTARQALGLPLNYNGPAVPSDPGPVTLAQTVDSVWTLDGVSCPAPWGAAGQDPGAPRGPGNQTFVDFVDGVKMGYDVAPLRYGGPSSPCVPEGAGPTRDIVRCVNSDWAPYVTGTGQCNDQGSFWLPPDVGACGNDGVLARSPYVSSGARAPSASQLPPSNRAWAFANLTSPNGTCNALSVVVNAAAVVCASQATGYSGPIAAAPPPIADVSDIVGLEAWLRQIRDLLRLSVGGLYVEKVPTRVIADFQTHQIGTGSKKGSHGAELLDMEQALSALPTAWTRVGTDLDQIALAIQGARIALTAANIQRDSALGVLALQRIQIEGQMAAALDGFLSQVMTAAGNAYATMGTSFSNLGAGLAAMMDSVDNLRQQAQQLDALATTDDRNQANQVSHALTELSKTVGPIWTDVQTSLDAIRASAGKVLADAEAIQLSQAKAQYEAAKGTGDDFVTIAGQAVPIPVNTVLRREASATQIRYQRALNDAKALAYMARRAIEQRIGVPLDAITTRVGPLDAPASWADDLCSLTGVNYKQLSTAATPDAGSAASTFDQAAIAGFADAFIGDYVAKLQSFVEYFNAQYPSHEGDDTAVLSLRSDLLPPVPQCQTVAPNLLINSGAIDQLVAPSASSQVGWRVHPCSATASKCLSVLSGSVLATPQDGPDGPRNTPVQAGSNIMFSSVATGVSWLSDTTQTAAAGDAGAPDGGAVTDGGSSSLPAGLVSQDVAVMPGTHILSWWDQARDPNGALLQLSATPVPYVVRVFDAGWTEVALFSGDPYVAVGSDAGPASLWSSRHVLTFTVAQPGTYHIAFGASTDPARLGSVAIADVQLETAQASAVPSTYVETTSTRVVTSYNCPRGPSDLRAAFEHRCESDGTSCYYELTSPVVVDSAALNDGTSPLVGKLAKGNFNFRHVTAGVNLVGTGVRDCSQNPTPACYGTGYVEYTLEHDASDAGIIDWNGDSRVFDFGTANIQHGKALAAERYITMPLSSADQALMAQPGILHMEFRGRPLDGGYRLRIWDSPALKWERLEDIQIVLQYRYWSTIQTQNQSH